MMRSDEEREELRRLRDRQREEAEEEAMYDALREHEAYLQGFITDNYFDIEMFHDFVFGKANWADELDENDWRTNRAKQFLKFASRKEAKHTIDSFTPHTFVWMLMNFSDLDEAWQEHLRGVAENGPDS